MELTRIKELIALSKVQTDAKLYAEVIIPALAAGGTSPEVPVGISGSYWFWCESLTISYTTKVAGPADDGAPQSSLKISDEGRDIGLFGGSNNGFIPVELLASPGRQRVTGLAGDPSNNLFYPQPFEHLFKAVSNIRVTGKTTADFENIIKVCFNGVKFIVTGDLEE